MTNAERENRPESELIRLITENPGLPVVPMVDAEICSEGWGCWMGAFGKACIDEYIIAQERVLFKSDDDIFDTLERYLSDYEYENLPAAESECRKVYDSLPWVKAIIVNIT